VLLVAVAAVLVPAVLLLGRRDRGQADRRDDLRRELERCLAQLAKLGLHPRDGECLGTFCSRAAEDHPELRETLHTLSDSYAYLRFAPPGTQGHRHARLHLKTCRRTLTDRRTKTRGAGTRDPGDSN